MTVKQLSLQGARMVARGRMRANTNYGPASAAAGGLYPLRMAAYQVDDYRLMAGWPVQVPDYEVRSQGLISAEGVSVAFRNSPREATTGALARWIAEEETFDQIAGRWLPYQSQIDVRWNTSPDYSPTYLEDYEYRSGTEKFFMDAVNFDADSREHMWMDMDSSIGGAAGYSVVMAVNLHSTFGDTASPYNGIWCAGNATPLEDTFEESPAEGFMNVTLQGNYLFLETDQTPRSPVLPVANLLALSQPVYLAFCFARPYTYLYAGTGPSVVTSASVFTGANFTPLSGKVVLGRSTGDVLHTADMAVLDLGIYGSQLSATEVRSEFGVMSSLYGGDK